MISIAMTTYNGAKYLQEQLDSILVQLEEDFELIICDDCSTDNSVEIIEKYIEKDSRIHFYKNEKNLGYVKNFEKAISLCKGDYIALSDQDDIWLPEHLTVLLEYLKKCNCSLVGGNALLVDSNNQDLNCKLINNNNLPVKTKDFNTMVLYRNVFQGTAILFEKDILTKALPFPDGMKYHDWWLALVASEMKGINYINVPVLRYRQHGNNASGEHVKDSFRQRIKKFFNSDLNENASRTISILENFKTISTQKQNIEQVLNYSISSREKNLSALHYFSKHYNEIYYNESYFKYIIRKSKMLLNILF
ncbi:MAG: glycosyltransferase family 2 protein [Methanobrevibacter sp.]